MPEREDTQAARHAGGWIVLACAILLLSMWHGLTQNNGPTRLHSHQPFRSTIDLNQASPAELCCIPHVGPSLAQRIVEYRQAHGPFQSLSDLDDVPGIGPNLRNEIAQAIDPLGDIASFDAEVAKATTE